MNLTSQQLSSFVLRRLFELLLTNFATCLQAISFGESEKRKLAEKEFGNKTLARDERTLLQASEDSLSAYTDTTPATGDDDDDDNKKYYYIGGAVIAGILIILIIVIGCCCARRGKKKKKSKSPDSVRETAASKEPPMNAFEPLEQEINTTVEEPFQPQRNNSPVITAVAPVIVHRTNNNNYSHELDISQSSQGYSKEPQSYIANQDVTSQRMYYGNEIQQSQQKGYVAPFQISDEETFQGKQRPIPKSKYELPSQREVDEREYYARKGNEITATSAYEENSHIHTPVYPLAINSSNRNLNHNIQDDRVDLERYDSVQRKMNPPPMVAPKPSINKMPSYRETEYMAKMLPNEEYRRNNIEKTYSYSVHEKRVTDKFPDGRVQNNSRRPQSLYTEDSKYNSGYKTRQSSSLVRKDSYDKRYSRDPSSFSPNKISTSNSLQNEDFTPPYKEDFNTKKDVNIPFPDYISASNKENLTSIKESKEEKPPIAPKPSIKPREFKGPYGPDDLDEMYNPLTMAIRPKNRNRMSFEVKDD